MARPSRARGLGRGAVPPSLGRGAVPPSLGHAPHCPKCHLDSSSCALPWRGDLQLAFHGLFLTQQLLCVAFSSFELSHVLRSLGWAW